MAFRNGEALRPRAIEGSMETLRRIVRIDSMMTALVQGSVPGISHAGILRPVRENRAGHVASKVMSGIPGVPRLGQLGVEITLLARKQHRKGRMCRSRHGRLSRSPV